MYEDIQSQSDDIQSPTDDVFDSSQKEYASDSFSASNTPAQGRRITPSGFLSPAVGNA